MSESARKYDRQSLGRLAWLPFDDDTATEMGMLRPRALPSDAMSSFASLLLEEKQARRAANEERKRFAETNAFDSSQGTKADMFCDGWDAYDFVTVAGILIALIGLVLAFIPATRSGGILFPIGTGLTAAAIYGANRKDQADD